MKKYLYVLPTLLTTMYIVFVGVCWLNNFSVNNKLFIVISCVFAIPILIHLFQTINAIMDSIKNNRVKWLMLLIIANIFMLPYYTNKYILNKIVLKNSVITYVISTIFLCALIGLYGLTLVGKNVEKIITTADGKVSFTLDSNWKKINEPGYSLYAENSKKKIAFGVSTFDLKIFEGYTSEGILEDQKNFLSTKFESIEIFSDLKEERIDDKLVKTTSYKVKTAGSDNYSIYVLSVIKFDSDPEYVLYIFEQVSENNYNKYKVNLDNIIKEVKLK